MRPTIGAYPATRFRRLRKSDALRRLAQETGLFMTGSSDYHGAGKPNQLGENLTTPDVLGRILESGTGSAAYLP